MQLTGYLVLLLVLFGVGASLLVIANMFFYTILGEVNATLPTTHQISMLGVNLRFRKVLKMHAELFPTSGKRYQMKIVGLAGFLFIGAAFLLDVIHYSH